MCAFQSIQTLLAMSFSLVQRPILVSVWQHSRFLSSFCARRQRWQLKSTTRFHWSQGTPFLRLEMMCLKASDSQLSSQSIGVPPCLLEGQQCQTPASAVAKPTRARRNWQRAHISTTAPVVMRRPITPPRTPPSRTNCKARTIVIMRDLFLKQAHSRVPGTYSSDRPAKNCSYPVHQEIHRPYQQQSNAKHVSDSFVCAETSTSDHTHADCEHKQASTCRLSL